MRIDEWVEVVPSPEEQHNGLSWLRAAEKHLEEARCNGDAYEIERCMYRVQIARDYGFSTLVTRADKSSTWHVFERDGAPCAEASESSAKRKSPLPFAVPSRLHGDDPFRRSYSPPPSNAVRVKDGWLVASNFGEFGAWLDWFSETGDSTYEISNHHVVDFVQVEGNLMAVEGLAHLSLSTGSVIRLVQLSDRWMVEEVAPLPAAPRIGLAHLNSILIVHGDGLARSTASGSLEQLVRFPYLGRLYPESALIHGQKLYVGMRGYVWEVDLETKAARLLAPRSIGDCAAESKTNRAE